MSLRWGAPKALSCRRQYKWADIIMLVWQPSASWKALSWIWVIMWRTSFVSRPGTMAQLCVLLHALPLIEWGVERRHDDCSLQVRSETDLLLWLPETDAHTAVQRWNGWRRFRRLSFSLWLRGHCAGLEAHHASASLSMALAVMAAYPGVSPVLNCLFVLWEHSCWEQTTAEQRAGTQRAPASFIRKARWDSLTHVPLKFTLSGPCHPLPGRCAPSGWPSHPTGSAVTTSTSATPRELRATRPLTHRVCSRGPIGGKWGDRDLFSISSFLLS